MTCEGGKSHEGPLTLELRLRDRTCKILGFDKLNFVMNLTNLQALDSSSKCKVVLLKVRCLRKQ